MSLKIRGWRKITKIICGSIAVLLLAAIIIRLVVWENSYYHEKEGSERDAPVAVEEEELIEEKPDEVTVREYTVAADRPRYLSIEKLGVVNARILPVGVNTKGELETPNNIFDVGWYEASGKPGRGKTLVIDGHNGGPHVHGVFKDLPSLTNGDKIVVERGDGEKFIYEVVENVAVSLEESDTYMGVALKSPEAGRESLTLISCTGEWSQTKKTYLSRQFTRAVLTK